MSSFSCVECGGESLCWHKRSVAETIRFMPKDDRTARELRQMEQTEREEVWADIVAHSACTTYEINPEEPDYIQQCLYTFDNEISKFKSLSKLAYEQSLAINPDYASNKSFKLMFLRADRFNEKHSAKRMVEYFELKKELFCRNSFGGTGAGSDDNEDDMLEILGRDVTLDDLTVEEQDIVASGRVRFLPESDHAGRSILFSRISQCDFENPHSELRAGWYVMNKMAIGNEQLQKLGCVNVPYMLDHPKNVNYESIRQGTRLMLCLPFRLVSIYALAEGSAWNNVLDFIHYALGRMIRLRTRTIYGSQQECVYSLLCLGFSKNNIPKELYEEDGVDNNNTTKKRKRRSGGIGTK